LPAHPVPRRDPRLDFFRGSAMFIIFIAHCRGNVLWNVIPARFGWSDAADMFVFVSGMAAAIAFGGSFDRHGFVIGTARILHRCWQLFVAHLGLFFASAALVVAGSRWFADTDYIAVLGLQHFFARPQDALLGLFALTYVPHYFDILPLYIVVLAMVPAAMLLARVHPLLVPAASIALYVATRVLHLNLPAHADDQPQWYFNPLAWQLIFFTGFCLRRGWLRVSLESPALLWAATAVLTLGLATSLPVVFEAVPAIDALRIWVSDHTDKTDLDLLQYLHFLASAYVILVILRGREQILLSPPLRPFVKCGQQALAVFVSGIVLSHAGGMIFDHIGIGWRAQVGVNLLCFALLFAVATLVAWIKSAPWKGPPSSARGRAATAAPSGVIEAAS
jgi:hypothetical protein